MTIDAITRHELAVRRAERQLAWVREVLKELGVTLETLAQMTTYESSYLSRIVNGTRAPSMAAAEKCIEAARALLVADHERSRENDRRRIELLESYPGA